MSHPTPRRRYGLWLILPPATRGRSRCFCLTFGELHTVHSGGPEVWTHFILLSYHSVNVPFLSQYHIFGPRLDVSSVPTEACVGSDEVVLSNTLKVNMICFNIKDEIFSCDVGSLEQFTELMNYSECRVQTECGLFLFASVQYHSSSVWLLYPSWFNPSRVCEKVGVESDKGINVNM